MSKGAKLKQHGTIVRISQQYNQPWRGFTLQRGHFYGEDERGYFVSAAMPGRNNTMIIYRCDTATGDYVWRKTQEVATAETVCKILEAAKNSGHKITFEPVSKQVERIYHPRLTAKKAYPWASMHIPCAGTRSKTCAVCHV